MGSKLNKAQIIDTLYPGIFFPFDIQAENNNKKIVVKFCRICKLNILDNFRG